MAEDLGSIIEYAETLADADAPSALPPGDYPAQVTLTSLGTSQTSGKQRVEVQFRIKPEDFPADYGDAESFQDGKTVRHYVGAEADRAARFRMRKFCEAIGAPLSSTVDINDWIGKTAVLTISNEEFEGIPQERVRKVSPA